MMKTIESKEHTDIDGRVHRHDLRRDGKRWQVECWVRPLNHEGTPMGDFVHVWTKGAERDGEGILKHFDEAAARAEFEKNVS